MIDLCSPVKPDSGEKESSSGLGGTSIVITTHYIEEARQAHRVGMMRFGKLLEEGHPDDLMARYLIRSFSKWFSDIFLKVLKIFSIIVFIVVYLWCWLRRYIIVGR